MNLIFIYGLPATGKLTVAQQLASLTGYRLFHNHLVVDCLLSVFDFGTPSFVHLREEIWLSVFEHACRNRLPGLIFTFAPEPSVRPQFPAQTIELLDRLHGEVSFVELTCPLEESKLRLTSPSRLPYQKLKSQPLFEQLHADGIFDTSHMPTPRLTVDTSLCSPLQAALQIRNALGLPQASPSASPDLASQDSLRL